MKIEAMIVRCPPKEGKTSERYMILLKNDRIAITGKEIYNSIALAAIEIKDLGHILGLDITFSVVANHEKEKSKEDNLIILKRK